MWDAITGRAIPEDSPAQSIVPVVSGVAFPRCRALLVGTSGTATVTDGSGTARASVPLQQGYNPIVATLVTLGTASNVWAIY